MDDKSTKHLNLRITDSEKQAFDMAAEVSGISTSGWVKERLRTAAAEELGRVGVVAPFLKSLLNKKENV